LNKFNTRMFKIFRNTIKYGDQIFLRDPDTFQLLWIDPVNLQKVIVNESQGRTPEQYVIRDMSPNFENQVASQRPNQDAPVPAYATAAPMQFSGLGGSQTTDTGRRITLGVNESCIDAEHVVHLSTSEGLDKFYPFGQSVLESVFKVYKQKEMLEDAILIYRIQRAPERRVFKIFTGNLQGNMATAFVERIKNEAHQKRIPGAQGGMDATYNPLSINEDYFFPVGPEGKGSSVEILPGGQQLGEIDDLRFFNNKLARGLRVPASYLPQGPEDNTQAVNDGKLGTALIQEHRFNQYCIRLQRGLAQVLDREFKMFLKWRGFNIDSAMFQLEFPEPQNFSSYRDAELATAQIAAFSQIVGTPFISKRFAMEKYLGLTKDEIAKNAKLWRQEAGKTMKVQTTSGDLRSAGASSGSVSADQDLEGMDFGGDMGADTADMGGDTADTATADVEAAPEV
jgi:hypothetical protein